VSSVLEQMIAVAREDDRTRASVQLGHILGGDRVVIFLRDREVGAFLPAPGFPQTLPGARAWRRLVDACSAAGPTGEAAAAAIVPPDGGDHRPAYALAGGADIVAVVLGMAQRPPQADEFRALLPLLERALQSERNAAHAQAGQQMAKQSAAHAEALATAFDQSRLALRYALAEAEESRQELAMVNDQLAHQAAELEAQTEELESQAAELTEQAAALQAMNAELEKARFAAERANDAKSQFLATMSHELRTPLNAIGGHAQLIELGIYGPVTAEQLAALDRINRSQRHLLGLINAILNLARIEAGRVEYTLADFPVTDVLKDLSPMVEPQLGAKDLRYTVSLCGPDLAVRADREKLEQILLNLLSNAIKFTQPGGRVEVTCDTREAVPGVVFIRVTDTGIGIPEGKVAAIFEPFVQVQSGHSRGADGTGLGLAISRDLARGMGGELRARSVLGEGSTFTLTLPAATVAVHAS
jgi:signal transduction histidine kinase